MKYGIDICSGRLFVQGDSFTVSWIHPVLYHNAIWHGFFVYCIYCVCLEEKRPRVTTSLRQPLRSSFPPWLTGVCRCCWDWLVGCAEFPLLDSGARKPRQSLIWLVAAFSKYESGCSTVSPLRKGRRRRENCNSITGTIWGTFRKGEILNLDVSCLP